MAMKTLLAHMSYLTSALLSILTVSIPSYGMNNSTPVSGLLADDPVIGNYAITLEVCEYGLVNHELDDVSHYYIGQEYNSIRLVAETDYYVEFLYIETNTKVLSVESDISYSLQCDDHSVLYQDIDPWYRNVFKYYTHLTGNIVGYDQ